MPKDTCGSSGVQFFRPFIPNNRYSLTRADLRADGFIKGEGLGLCAMFWHLAGVAQLVERQLPKLNVDGSSPFTRFAS